MSNKFSWHSRAKSFGFAFEGLAAFFKSQHNARIHFVAAVLVTALGIYVGLSHVEWIIISFAVALVFAAELINTAIEQLCDIVSTEFSPTIKFIKDVSSAAVLVIAIAAAVAGLIIFIPKFI